MPKASSVDDIREILQSCNVKTSSSFPHLRDRSPLRMTSDRSLARRERRRDVCRALARQPRPRPHAPAAAARQAEAGSAERSAAAAAVMAAKRGKLMEKCV